MKYFSKTISSKIFKSIFYKLGTFIGVLAVKLVKSLPKIKNKQGIDYIMHEGVKSPTEKKIKLGRVKLYCYFI